MVPSCRSCIAPPNYQGTSEHNEVHIPPSRSTRAVARSGSSESHLTATSALYIFVGVLITLCVAAPIIAALRRKLYKTFADLGEHLRSGRVQMRARAFELESLRQDRDRLVQEQNNHQSSQQRDAEKLKNEVRRNQEMVQQIHDLELSVESRGAALAVLRRERDTALDQERDAQRLCTTKSQEMQTLRSEAQTKEDSLTSLQQKFNIINQECRQLTWEMARRET